MVWFCIRLGHVIYVVFIVIYITQHSTLRAIYCLAIIRSQKLLIATLIDHALKQIILKPPLSCWFCYCIVILVCDRVCVQLIIRIIIVELVWVIIVSELDVGFKTVFGNVFDQEGEDETDNWCDDLTAVGTLLF